MAKQQITKRRYKSTSFSPKTKKMVLPEIDYRNLVISTLKEKYQLFVIGLGVLLGLITGASYLLLNNGATPKLAFNTTTAVNKTSTQETPQPTLVPTKVIAKITVPSHKLTDSVTTNDTSKPNVDPTKAAQAAAAQPGKGSSRYVVKKGDTLWKIAEKAYKSGFNYKDVIAYNKISNPDKLLVGQELLLPTVVPDLPTDPTVLARGGIGGPSNQAAISATMTDVITDSSTNYKVLPGDTLWGIASRTLGDGFSWKDIAKANGVTNPVALEVGTTLVIPR